MTARFLSSGDPSDSGSSQFPLTGLLVALAVGAAVAFAVVVLIICCTRRGSKKKSRVSQGVVGDGGRRALRRFRYEELDQATESFSDEHKVGSGAFGFVYKGVIDGETLAIKKARPDSYLTADEFRNEVELLSMVKHENLVGLLGYCEEKGQKILVYEYVPNGTLIEYIIGRKRRQLGWRQRVNIAIGAAKGIAHLHEGIHPGIIHRDIKPSNILVDDNFEAKVSDFGLVKMGPVGDASHVSSQIKGTPGYLDPAYCSSLHLSPFSDVYSFGVILLQLVAARPALGSPKLRSDKHIIDWARPSIERGMIEEILDTTMLIEPCCMEMMLKMGQLGLRCVVKSPKNRPTMSQVARELEEALRATLSTMSKQPSKGDREESQSFSIDGFGFQKFIADTNGLATIHSPRIRCLDVSSHN